MALYDRIFKPAVHTLSNGKTVQERRSRLPLVLVLVLAGIVVSAKVTGFDLKTLVRRGGYFWVMLRDMVPPDWAYMPKVWRPLWDTIKMSLLGSAAGALLCIPFALLCSSNLVHNRFVTGFFKLVFSVVRTLPTLVSALIATYIFGLGTVAGTIAITVFTFAYCGKILYENIETCSMGPHEALIAMGLGRIDAARHAVWPQVLPTFLSTVLFCFEGNVRYASILGYVGAGGLGILLQEKIGWREYGRVGMILLALFLAVVAIESVSQELRRRLN